VIHRSRDPSPTVGFHEDEDLMEGCTVFEAMKNIEIDMANSELIIPLRLNIGEHLCAQL